MHYFTETAASHRAALEKIRDKYGDDAKIMNHRTVRVGGILGFFAKEGVEISGYVSQEKKQESKATTLEDEKRKILQAVKTDQAIKEVLSEVRSLKESLESGAISLSKDSNAEEHESIKLIDDLLVLNDFTQTFRNTILHRLKSEFSLEQLSDFNLVQETVLDWIGDSVQIYDEPLVEGPRIFVLVGPTGVGKTTTIAKIAANYGLGSSTRKPQRVRMITIDNYRIGAKQQIETYGSIMGIPVSCVETFDDLRKTIAMYRDDADFILVDTIGKSPRDSVKLAEMKELLQAVGSRAETHLALSAIIKPSDMKEILTQFAPFDYRSVVITKLDETIRTGNVISVLAEARKPVSFVTDGQRVPQDIEKASALRFLMNLEGFRVNRPRLEKRFPTPQSARINWR